MQSLTNSVKELSFEELEKRYQEINKRMQKLRMWNQTGHEMYYQLQVLKDEIDFEREERFVIESNKDVSESSIVVNTDPLPDDEDQILKQKQPTRQRQYTIL
jgi:ribosomal protein L29